MCCVCVCVCVCVNYIHVPVFCLSVAACIIYLYTQISDVDRILSIFVTYSKLLLNARTHKRNECVVYHHVLRTH